MSAAGGFEPFARDSMMWRINRERVVLLAGPAAAVLQAAHPQVAMGVAAHSKFRSDSIGRLRRTLDAVYAVAFGSGEEVDRVRESVGRAHRAVQGKAPEAYSAFDPGAQLWVLATLVMASATMYRRYVGPLGIDELNAFLRENARFGTVFGVAPNALPQTWSAFETYWDEMMQGDLLGSHPLCGEVARAVVKPDAPWTMRALSPVFRALAFEFLPATLRVRLGFPESTNHAWLWRPLDRTLPSLMQAAPASLRYASQYLQATRRQ